MSLPTEKLPSPEVVWLELRARSGAEAVRALHKRVSQGTDAVVDPPKFLAALLDRMSEAPVCIAPDVALPHARTDSVSRLVLGVGRLEEPVPFDAQHPAVRLVFLFGTPRAAVTEYLHAAAAVARTLRHGLVRAALMAAATEAEFRAALTGGIAAPR